MISIGDFARLGRVSVRMLRHYDTMGLLRPEHVDPHTGYRYYRPEQLRRLNRIVALKDLGLRLEQVRSPFTSAYAGKLGRARISATGVVTIADLGEVDLPALADMITAIEAGLTAGQLTPR